MVLIQGRKVFMAALAARTPAVRTLHSTDATYTTSVTKTSCAGEGSLEQNVINFLGRKTQRHHQKCCWIGATPVTRRARSDCAPTALLPRFCDPALASDGCAPLVRATNSFCAMTFAISASA